MEAAISEPEGLPTVLWCNIRVFLEILSREHHRIQSSQHIKTLSFDFHLSAFYST